MNAVARAVTRRAIYRGAEVFGIRHGCAGLIASDFIPLGARERGFAVGLQRGEITATALSEVAGKQRPLDPELFELARSLAR